MYTSLNIAGFRRFKQLQLSELKQVNLLVGRNNSGKSSVLEAISILASPGSMVEFARRRGELLLPREDQDADPRGSLEEEIDISCLFHQYALSSEFRISSAGAWKHELKAIVDQSSATAVLSLQMEDSPVATLDLTEQGGLPTLERDSRGLPRRARHHFPQRSFESAVPRVLIEPNGFTARKLSRW